MFKLIIRMAVICLGCGESISRLESIVYGGLCKECYKKAN